MSSWCEDQKRSLILIYVEHVLKFCKANFIHWKLRPSTAEKTILEQLPSLGIFMGISVLKEAPSITRDRCSASKAFLKQIPHTVAFLPIFWCSLCSVLHYLLIQQTIPVVERFQARVCGRSLAGIAGSNPAEGMDVCTLWVLYVIK
jgi:hypothetical protein